MLTRLVRPIASLVVMLLVTPPCSVGAQATPDRARLALHIVDEQGSGIVGAEIALLRARDERHTVRSDAAGAALVTGIEPGIWSIAVRRLGVRPISTIVRLAAGENELTLVATPLALTLTGVRIVGGVPWSARLDDFERRRAAGIPNATVTRAQIDKLDPPKLSRMLRGMAGLRVGDSLGVTVAIANRSGKPTRGANAPGTYLVQCVMRVVVDGVMMPALFDIDQLVPRDVHGIEVYYGPARLPPELAGMRTDNWCGVVAVWTREG